MKKPAFILALLLSTAAAGAIASPGALSRSEPPPAQEPRAEQPTHLAQGFTENFWGRDHRGERQGHRERHADKDEDDDDDERGGREHGRNGGANRQADPNAANAPVPDNGVFNGKARPKVEVQ
jgi:hypothetical protein